jgi:hypothetical protein
MDDGYACFGDSGGPIVVKKKRVYVLAAVVTGLSPLGWEWPPACLCNCNDFPEYEGEEAGV